MLSPVSVIFQHLCIQRLRKFTGLGICSEKKLNVFQCEHSLPHGKCKHRPYFQDAHAIFYKLAQLDFCLVICRMSLKNKTGKFFDRCHQIFCFFPVILCASAVFFLHTGLNYNADHTVPYILSQSRVTEGFLKCRYCVFKIFHLRNLYAVIFTAYSAARNRNFTSYNIYRRYSIRVFLQNLPVCILRDLRQTRSPPCNNLV